MNLDLMLVMLYDKDTSQAFENLKELEQLSENSNELYPYLTIFFEMISSEKYAIRVRGFRLLCKQAKWDTENRINNNLESALAILNDDKPTAVRQALAALQDVALYKKELREIIKEKISSIDCFRYKDSMQGLITKDIDKLLLLMQSQ